MKRGDVLILNLHGYASSGSNMKYMWLSETYPDVRILSPTVNYDAPPADNLDFMVQIVKDTLRDGDKLRIVGTSMGGFFSYCLSHIFSAPALMFNPALMPFITLRKYGLPEETLRGYAKVFSDYVFLPDADKLKFVLGRNDDVVNHRDSLTISPYSETLMLDCGHIIIIEDGGKTAEFSKKALGI